MAVGRKTGGRKKGTPNKASRVAIEILKDLKFEPLKEMVGMYNAANTPIEQRVKLACEIAGYVHPKRKATEMTGAEGGPLLVTWRAS